jgi:hypothetical protein
VERQENKEKRTTEINNTRKIKKKEKYHTEIDVNKNIRPCTCIFVLNPALFKETFVVDII